MFVLGNRSGARARATTRISASAYLQRNTIILDFEVELKKSVYNKLKTFYKYCSYMFLLYFKLFHVMLSTKYKEFQQKFGKIKMKNRFSSLM